MGGCYFGKGVCLSHAIIGMLVFGLKGKGRDCQPTTVPKQELGLAATTLICVMYSPIINLNTYIDTKSNNRTEELGQDGEFPGAEPLPRKLDIVLFGCEDLSSLADRHCLRCYVYRALGSLERRDDVA